MKILNIYYAVNIKIQNILIHLGQNVYYYFFIPLIFFSLFLVISHFNNQNETRYLEVLTSIISIASITVAILITYMFTKIFDERNARIEYKKKVDTQAVKIHHLRQLLFRIRNAADLWTVDKYDLHQTMISKYPDLTYEEYNSFDYNEHEQIISDTNGLIGHAYLAMKGFADGDDSFLNYSELNDRNYTVDDISRYIEYQSTIYSFLEKYKNEPSIFDAKKVNKYWFSRIQEYFTKISGTELLVDSFKTQLIDLLTAFHEKIYQEHTYYNQFLTRAIPKVLTRIFGNIIVNVVLVILSLLLIVVNIDSIHSLACIIVAMFIVNIIDLVVIIYSGIVKELRIEERYTL